MSWPIHQIWQSPPIWNAMDPNLHRLRGTIAETVQGLVAAAPVQWTPINLALALKTTTLVISRRSWHKDEKDEEVAAPLET
eukprot:CAMPEP_0115065372 /NCGR_PEP_ID=MMETSP0227-20121206/10215_1 /TAXON_ID=89957 /ORGANISM="Polarella glacialis, Strain CCMP 1383" /LENGTH=80 /DNA_ID=CAMNT_0002451155 /DNA_START=369 /DNA_END=606 /DNA_ORIENTATION=-